METIINLIIAIALYITGAQAEHQQEITQHIETIIPQELYCKNETQICSIKNEHLNNNIH